MGASLEKGAAAAPKGGSAGLQACQTAALYGGSGLEECGSAPALSGIKQWLNTPGGKPVTLAALKGKVVLVSFWAYSCINCQRELPHVEAWAKDYAADGLEVVGVHTPEYAFEHVPSNVTAGARRLGLTFPVALDNSYDTWTAYDNQYRQRRTSSTPAARSGTSPSAKATTRARSSSSGSCSARRTPGSPCRGRPLSPTPPPTTRRRHRRPILAPSAGKSGRTAYATGQFMPPATLPPNSFALAGSWTIGQESHHRGHGRRDHARLPRLERLSRRRRHRHAHRLGGRHEQGHPRLRRPRHLHRRHRAARPGRHRDHQALTGTSSLLVHLRLTL